MLGITPDNIELYKLALIHRSASIHLPDGGSINNERLEFLGDAVLETIVSDYLFIAFPDKPEGFLTQVRSKLVSRQSLNELANKIGLDRYVVANSSGAFVQKHLYGNAMEALIGAVYLDKGYDTANRIIIDDIFGRYVDLGDVSQTESDFKSRLIEWCQKSKHSIEFHTEPVQESSAHSPRFVSKIVIDTIDMGNGTGSSKKEADQQASFAVWQMLDDNIGDYFLNRIDMIEQQRKANGDK